MAEFIASGTTEVTSDDFTLADGESVTLNLFSPTLGYIPRDCCAELQLKTSADTYITAVVFNADRPAGELASKGTYRIIKRTSDSAFGVDKT